MGKPPRSSSGGITCAITMSLTCSVERRYFVLIGQPRPIRVPRSIGSHGSTTQSSSRGSRRSATSAHMACVGYGLAGCRQQVTDRSRAASLSGPIRRGTVPAHLFAYQLAHGVIPRLGWSGAEDAVICHQCDFAGCTNPAHMRLGTNSTNRAEYIARRKNVASPLADVRGAAGRTRAIAAANRTGLPTTKILTASRNGFEPLKSRDFRSLCGDDESVG